MWTAILLVMTMLAQGGAPEAGGAPDSPIRVDFRSRVALPHRWGVDFVKRGPHLFVTGSESHRQFATVDVSNPADMRVMAQTAAGPYAARNLCLFEDFALVNCYRWLCAVDIQNPLRPRTMDGCALKIDAIDSDAPRLFYRHAVVGRHLLIACSNPKRALRVYAIDRQFLPRLVATCDLSAAVDRDTAQLMADSMNLYPNAELLVEGTLAHTSYGMHIAGFDLADIEKPKPLYVRKMPANVLGLAAAAGGRLLVAVQPYSAPGTAAGGSSRAGVLVVNVTGSATAIIGTYSGMPRPERLLVRGQRAYVVGQDRTPPNLLVTDGVPLSAAIRQRFEQTLTLHVLDLSDISKPVRTGGIAFPPRVMPVVDGVCRAMALEGDTLFIAEQAFGIHAVNVADNANPGVVGSLRLVTHEVRGVVPHGAALHVINDSSIQRADLADVSRPALAARASMDEIGGWGVTQPVLGGGGRFMYSVYAGGRDIATIDALAMPARLVGLHPLPPGWLARGMAVAALSPSMDHLAVLAYQDSGRTGIGVLVFETEAARPMPAGGNAPSLRLTGSHNIARMRASVGAGWGVAFAATGSRALVMQPQRPADAAHGVFAPATSLDLFDVAWRPDGQSAVQRPVDLLSLAADCRPTYVAGSALALRDGHLYFHALDQAAGLRRSMLLAIDVRRPGDPRIVGRLADPVTGDAQFLVRNVVAATTEPMLACSSEAGGAWLVDIRDPAHPKTLWREQPFTRGSDALDYAAQAKPPPAFDGRRLFVPRLDCVDIFELSPAGMRRAGIAASQPTPRLVATQSKSPPRIDGDAGDWPDESWTPFAEGSATIRWSWDSTALYVALRARDDQIEPDAHLEWLPYRGSGDHVDIFVTRSPAAVERAYGDGDCHFRIDVDGRVSLNHQSPRLRGGGQPLGSHPAPASRAAVLRDVAGYTVEAALAWSDIGEATDATGAGAPTIAFNAVVVDRGRRDARLVDAEVDGYLAVQPTWLNIMLQGR